MTNLAKEFCEIQRLNCSFFRDASDEYILKFMEAEYIEYVAHKIDLAKKAKSIKNKITIDYSGDPKWKI